MEFIDLRSDTVTQITPSMKEAMLKAPLGDDGYREDPTVIELEEYAANLLGKEAAVLVPTGVFANQLAIFTHCKRGQEVILADDCHIVQWETGGAAVISQVQLRTLTSNKGALDPKEVEAKIRKDLHDPHVPHTGLICVENAFSTGCVVSLESMKNVKEVADKYEIPVHLDGARIFNAAAALKVEPKEIAQHATTLMFCLSKGLCGSMGSLLVGPKEFVDRARKNRKLLGGSMRQSGIFAAAGLVGLKEIAPRLGEDHKIARMLGEGINGMNGVVKVKLEDIQINMIFFGIESDKIESRELVEYFLKNGIKMSGRNNTTMLYRFVTHYYIQEEQVKKVISTLKEFLDAHL